MITDSATANRSRITGDQHAETVDLPLDDIANRLAKDLDDVQGDGMLPADAKFSVTADHAGSEPILRVTVTSDADISSDIAGIAGHIAMQLFQLASVYNEVNLDQSGDARFRFLQDIHVTCADNAEARLVGAMVQS